jgi:DNA-binding response OmpR family regulator
VPARILVVDDEPLVARAVLRILERHQPVWVATAELAIERLASERFDLVLCDLMLGGKTGLDVRAAAGPEQRDKFLFITGGALTESARDLLASEPERFVTKPFTPVELRRRVDAALLARRGPATRASEVRAQGATTSASDISTCMRRRAESENGRAWFFRAAACTGASARRPRQRR